MNSKLRQPPTSADPFDHVAPSCPQCGYDTRQCPTTTCPECGTTCSHADWIRIGLRRGRIVVALWIVASSISIPVAIALCMGSSDVAWGFVDASQAIAAIVSLCVLMCTWWRQIRVGHTSRLTRVALVFLSFICWGPIGWLVSVILIPFYPILVPIGIATVLWVGRK